MNRHLSVNKWFAVQPENCGGWWIVSSDPNGDFSVDDSGDGGFEEDVARLVSAAPEMRLFIKDLVDIIKKHGGIVGCESVVLDSAEHLLRKINGDNE